jgi:hypothetical protein
MHYLSKGKPMKLDALTPDELECYEEWNSADEYGGDCSTQGYAWAAWQNERIIILEDDQGFVEAHTYTVAEANLNSLSVGTYFARVESLRAADAAFDAECQELAERESAIEDAASTLLELEGEENGPCDSCNKMFISTGAMSAVTHEHGCPRYARLVAAREHLERLEDY